MLNQLLATNAWILDLIFVLILVLGTALGAYKGFIAGICKLAGKWFSIIFAFMFCIAFANFLEVCFHMTSAITSGLAGSIAKNELYAVGLAQDISGAELNAALSEIGIGAIPRWIIRGSFASVEVIPAGTTAATLIASVLAKWISIVISFILLIIIMRLGVSLVAKLFGKLIHSFTPLRVVDQALGAVLGFAKTCFLIFILLAICQWLPFNSLHAFIESSNIVGKIAASEWFHNATSYAISGKWFNQYVKSLIK